MTTNIEANSRFNALYGLEEENNGEDNVDDNESILNNAEAQSIRKDKTKENMRKNPILDLNEIEESQESPIEQIPSEKENVEVRQQREWRQRPNQAVTENEHVVVRGTNKGKSITRTIITIPNENMEAANIIFMEEHHNDPHSMKTKMTPP